MPFRVRAGIRKCARIRTLSRSPHPPTSQLGNGCVIISKKRPQPLSRHGEFELPFSKLLDGDCGVFGLRAVTAFGQQLSLIREVRWSRTCIPVPAKRSANAASDEVACAVKGMVRVYSLWI